MAKRKATGAAAAANQPASSSKQQKRGAAAVLAAAAPPADEEELVEEAAAAALQPAATSGGDAAAADLKNKERVLVVSSRGITFRCGGWRGAGGGMPHAWVVPPPLHALTAATTVVPSRYRHLLLDLLQLLPHSKKDAKLDTKTDRALINEVADMKVRKTGGRGPGVVGCRVAVWVSCGDVVQERG